MTSLPLSDSPAWGDTPPLTLERCLAAFDSVAAYTVGVEEELMLVEPGTLDLAPAIDEVLPLLAGDERFAKELRPAQIELITPVCATAGQACIEIAGARRRLVEILGGRYRLLACGTHPFSTRHGEITAAERYRQIADEYPWAATRSLVCGLHIHVAVPGAARALAVYNALRSYLPAFAALGANSAFYEGADTGMCSVRPRFNETYPRSGIPPALGSWQELVDFVDWGRRGGLFPDASHLWWEMRPHPVHGTIEIRVADAQTRVADVAALTAFVQATVVSLADRYDGGERLPVHETYRISENAWRAHRHGVRGWIVDLDTGERVAMRDALARLFDALEPYAEQQDAAGALLGARSLIAGTGSERQRYVAEHEGIDGLTRWLVDQTEESAFDA